MAFRDYPYETRVVIDGLEAYLGGPESITGRPTILEPLQFPWGRESNVDQPDVGTCSFTIRQELRQVDEPTPMLDIIGEDSSVEVWVDVLDVSDPTVPRDGKPVLDSLLVWAGSVVTADAGAAGDYAVEVQVTATEPAASLADETIGDQPWPVQSAGTRVARIAELAQTDTAPITVDPTLAGVRLTARDVDAQNVLPLLQDVAQSVGGVLWSAADPDAGAYLWLEDPSNRASLRQFLNDATSGLVTITNNVPASSLVTAADLLRDPVRWRKDKTQAINSVDVTWQQQGIDDNGLPTATARTETITQPGAKIIRKLSIETELVEQVDAVSLASHVFALSGSTGGWSASGLTIDTTALEFDLDEFEWGDRLAVINLLLDGRARLGRPLTLIDLPGWTPGGSQASVYVEGGTYSLASGRWTLELNVSSATGQGRSATFADFAGTGVRVRDFDPSIKIRDAWGVSGPDAVSDGFGVGQFGVQAFGL